MSRESVKNGYGRRLFFVLVLFCFIFNFTLAAINVAASIFVLMGCLAVLLMNPRLQVQVFRAFVKNAVFLWLLIAMGLYGSFLSVVMGDGELVFFGIFVKNVVVFLIACVLGPALKEEAEQCGIVEIGAGVSFVLDLCYVAIFLQAVLVVLTFVSAEIKDLLAGAIVNRGNIEVDHAFRFRGLHDSGGFTLGVMLGVGAVYGMYSFVVNRSRWSWLRVIMAVTIIFSTTLVARTGIAVVLIGLVLLLLRFPTRRHFLAYVLITAFFMAAIFLASILMPEQYEFFNEVVFKYAFEALVNYQSGAGIRTESSDDLKTMLFLPDAIHVIFGSGSYDITINGVERSDSGYMKTMLSSGILGFVVIYLVYAGIACRIGKALLHSRTGIYSFMVILAIIYLIIEVKSPVLYQNDTSRLFWLIYGTVLAYQNSSQYGVIGAGSASNAVVSSDRSA